MSLARRMSRLVTPRLGMRLAPILAALLLGWSYADSFLHPTFFGDQGWRLDHADEVVFEAGPRIWLPFLQLHIHALYLLHAPVEAYLLIPFGYAVLSLFLLTALCRAALPDNRAALVATILLLTAFSGASFQWLGRSLYQEAIMIPGFLALMYLFYFAPLRRGLFLVVFAAGLLTREIFWLWWLVFLALPWRVKQPDSRLRVLLGALGAIPLAWLAWTGQPPLLGRLANNPHILFDGLGRRAAILGGHVVSESLLPLIVVLLIVFSLAMVKHGFNGLAYRGYHLFSLVSLGAIYGYVLLFDPWLNVWPGNTRVLVPLYAHLLVWSIVAVHEVLRLDGRTGVATRILCAAGILSLLKIPAIMAVLGGATPRTGVAWEPLRLATGFDQREDWRTTLGRSVLPLREARKGRLEIAFVDIEKDEYLKFWVAPFLYDARTSVADAASLARADIVVAPEDALIPGFHRQARLQLPGGIVRDLLTREVRALTQGLPARPPQERFCPAVPVRSEAVLRVLPG